MEATISWKTHNRTIDDYSPVEKARLKYQPSLPPIFKENCHFLTVEETLTPKVDGEIAKLFPNLAKISSQVVKLDYSPVPSTKIRPYCVGVVFSGGQAPGGHNCISGLYDFFKHYHPKSKILGFLDGPSGIVQGRCAEITGPTIDLYRNQGGFDMLGSGRTKIESPEQLASSLKVCQDLKIDALVVIGGDDSNTNAAMIAEYFKAQNSNINVIGLPKTIDGDLKEPKIGLDISFGFSTATAQYSNLIGNVATDVVSAKKYWFFIKLMGRSASWITLECALQCRPNFTIISEEVQQRKMSLGQIVGKICDAVCVRAAQGKDYGIVLIPEGFIEFISQIKALISTISDLLASGINGTVEDISKELQGEDLRQFQSFPDFFQKTLLMPRDPHGNVPLSQIQTEQLLIEMVTTELKDRKAKKIYSGSFKPQAAFFGYEGRSCLPTNFDAAYCQALGYTAGGLIVNNCTGLMAVVKNLALAPQYWVPTGVAVPPLLVFEKRKGKMKAVIQKGLVDLNGFPFQNYLRKRGSWIIGDQYRNPGPVQFFGSGLTDRPPKIVYMERFSSTPSRSTSSSRLLG